MSKIYNLGNLILYKPQRTEEEKKCPYYLVIKKNESYDNIDEHDIKDLGYTDANDFYAQVNENNAIGVAVKSPVNRSKFLFSFFD